LSLIHKIPLTKKEQNQQPLIEIKLKNWIETLPDKISSKKGQLLFDEYFASLWGILIIKLKLNEKKILMKISQLLIF